MATIKIEQLTFGFDKQGSTLFSEANLLLDTHWKLGLIGRNGRGKTTLLHLLLGHYSYHGRIDLPVEAIYFPAAVHDKERLTYEVLGEAENFELWELEREMNLIQLNPAVLWQPFSTLSGGEQTKALLAMLFTQTDRFPLIDEPTNHLDGQGRQHVADYLQKKSGFIVVSHDRRFMDQVTDHTLAIEKSQLILYQGNFSTYEEQKKLRDDFEQAQNRKIKKEVTRLKQTAAEKAEWSHHRETDKYGKPSEKGSGAINDTGFIGARAARVMKRSKTLNKRMAEQIHDKEGLLKDLEEIDSLSMDYQPTHHQQLLKVENLSLRYQEDLFSALSFEVNKGEIIALTGPNGSGKSSIFSYLLGQFDGQIAGSHLQPKQLTISYVRQNYEDNHGTLQDFAEKHRLNYSAFLNNLRKLGMERAVFNNLIEEMSMGQRKKVELAKSLSQAAELYLWDEPLNYLDVFNQQQLEELLLRVRPAMLIIEHDHRFLETIGAVQIPLEK
ncbi:ribosomal protection-like ABC-F family protein [Candidatus Enterococcus ferrettii]|uniref:Lincosamide and streptogramin A transport system ATP-binding/permease n=1 Tax=Candidatus Enterococcus ferrettii TaxID=2815324 RepID=A0ABV0EUR2_9ENTE|nr:ABC-F type ribosomal protection protein [Enterococcus sp. 665A]MBO1339318.1 ABC-F type ribosomal protection protein [Enterococcus sp. 665A]